MKFVTPELIEKVTQAVEKAESRTSGEIVPMIVKRSSMVGQVPYQLAVLWFIVVLALYEWIPDIIFELFSYTTFWVIAIVGAGFFLWAGNLSFFQRLLTSQAYKTVGVFQRAQLEFYQIKMQETRDRTGILIFVSLMEHQCVVLADKGIAEKLPDETWQGVVQQVIDGIKRKDPAGGLIAAVHTCGELLAQHFPPRPDDKNELPNKLIVKD